MIYYVIIDLVLTAMFFVAAGMYVREKVNDDSFWKGYYAKDTALLLDSMVDEGDIKIEYEVMRGYELFEFEFLPGKVNVYTYRTDVSKEQQLPAVKLWAKPEPIDFESITFVPATFYFQKQGNKLFINEASSSLLSCPTVQTGISKVFFKPIDSGANNIVQMLRNNPSIKNSEEADAEIVMALKVDKLTENNLKVHYSENEVLKNHKLACLITNSIISKHPDYFTEPSLEPYDLSQLSDKQVVVQIWLGLKDTKDMQGFADAISGGILEYYGTVNH